MGAIKYKLLVCSFEYTVVVNSCQNFIISISYQVMQVNKYLCKALCPTPPHSYHSSFCETLPIQTMLEQSKNLQKQFKNKSKNNNKIASMKDTLNAFLGIHQFAELIHKDILRVCRHGNECTPRDKSTTAHSYPRMSMGNAQQ